MNILFLAFEGEANSMGNMAVRFKAKGHKVLVVSCDHFNVTHSRGEVFEHYRSIGLTDSEFTNLDGVFSQMNSCPENLSEQAVDWEFLRRFETIYGKRFTLLELISMEPMMSGTYHHRDFYYRPENKALLFKFLELQLSWLEGLFQQFGFDAVLTMNFQYFVKAAVFTMCEALEIPFLMVATSRIEDIHLIYDNFSLGTPGYVTEEMQRLQVCNDSCDEAAQYMKRLKEDKKPAYFDFEETLQRISQRLSLKKRLHELLRYTFRYPRKAIFIDKHYRGLLKRNYFLPSYFSFLRAMAVSIWRSTAYFRHPELTRVDLPGVPFVFFPLHLIPENSVLTLSKTINEMECLFQLSKALPVNWKIVVKINPNMLSEIDTHPNNYYLEMSRLPNVQFINPLIRSGEIIEKATAVACISGTALLEAAIFGKRGFRWGRTEFEAVNTIFDFSPDQVQSQLSQPVDSNAMFYIQACFNLGIRLNQSIVNAPVNEKANPQQQAKYESQLSALENMISEYLQMHRHQAELHTV